MNRQQALEWLVENVVKWPKGTISVSPINLWHWAETCGGEIILTSGYSTITQSDWLAATDSMKEKCDE